MLKQSYRPVRRIKIWGWLTVLVLSFALNSLWEKVVTQVVHPFKVPTEVMVPAIKPGDHLMAERISHWFGSPKRGDIVVFNTRGLNYAYLTSDTYYMKRIAGLPGETVQIVPPNLLINGEVVNVKDLVTSARQAYTETKTGEDKDDNQRESHRGGAWLAG